MKTNKDLYLLSFYMPHRNLKDIIKLNLSLKKLSGSNKNKHILLAGDFKCQDIDWDTLTVWPKAQDREVQQAMIDLSIEHRLTQVHNQPTWNENVSDLVFMDNASLVKNLQSIPGIGNHAMVVTDWDIKPVYDKQKPKKVYLFSKANWEEIYKACEKLSNSIISITNNEVNIEDLWSIFKTGIQDAMDKFKPSKIFKKKNIVPWFNRKLKRMTHRKTRLYRHAKKSKQWNKFKQYQKLCKKEFKSAETDYVNKTIQEGFENNNCKPFWRYIKSKWQDNIGVAPSKVKGNLNSDNKDKAQILVEQFYSVFNKMGKRILPILPKQFKFELPGLKITVAGVIKLLQKINTSKAIGLDISNVILKQCAKHIAPGQWNLSEIHWQWRVTYRLD